MRERAQRFDPRQEMHSKSFEVFHYSKPWDEEVQVHHHNFYEVFCFLDGDVEYWVEGSIYRLKPGDIMLINPMVLHRPVLKPDCKVYERIVLWIDTAFLESISSNDISLSRCFNVKRPDHTVLIRPDSLQRSSVISKLSELVRENYSTDYAGNLCAYGIFIQFMVELNRMSVSVGKAAPKGREESGLVSGVLEYISAHYSEELSLESLARRFFVSKYHLSHEFSRTVGTSVYRYIMLKRLIIARQMLAQGVSAGEVSGMCGFNDYTNFFRAFKAEYGINPRAFAAGQRQ